MHVILDGNPGPTATAINFFARFQRLRTVCIPRLTSDSSSALDLEIQGNSDHAHANAQYLRSDQLGRLAVAISSPPRASLQFFLPDFSRHLRLPPAFQPVVGRPLKSVFFQPGFSRLSLRLLIVFERSLPAEKQVKRREHGAAIGRNQKERISREGAEARRRAEVSEGTRRLRIFSFAPPRLRAFA